MSSAVSAGEKAAEPSKVQERVGRALRQLASEIDKRTQGQKVMLVEIPGEHESDLASRVQSLVLQAMLAESVLVAPLAEEDQKALRDDKGKLSMKSVLGPPGLEHLRTARELKFLVLHQNWSQQRFVVRDQLPSYPAKDLVIWRPGVRS